MSFRDKSVALKRVDQFRRDVLREELAKCNQQAQTLFQRMYPEGIDNMALDKLDWATFQCENTLKE